LATGGILTINQQFVPDMMIDGLSVNYELNGVAKYYSDIIAIGATFL